MTISLRSIIVTMNCFSSPTTSSMHHRFQPHASPPPATKKRPVRADSAMSVTEETEDAYAGWFLRIYNLDSSTRDSAERHARRIIASLPPSPSVPIDRLIYFSGERPTKHNLTRVSVRLPSIGYVDGSIHEDALYALRNAITAAGHECLIASSSGNDLHTVLNYVIQPSLHVLSGEWAERQTKMTAAQSLREVFARLRCVLVTLWDWDLCRSPIEVRGSCAELSPQRCLELVSKSPHRLDNGDMVDFQFPHFYTATRFTTLALWTNGKTCKEDDYRAAFDVAMTEYALCHGQPAKNKNLRITHDGKFVLVDPETHDLASFLCRTIIKGSFPRPLFRLNAPRTNLNRKHLVAYQDLCLAKRTEADDADAEGECGSRGRLIETWRPPPRWERWLDRQRHLSDSALHAAAQPSRFNAQSERSTEIDPDDDPDWRPTPLVGDPPPGQRSINPLLGTADQAHFPIKVRYDALRALAGERDVVLPRRPGETLRPCRTAKMPRGSSCSPRAGRCGNGTRTSPWATRRHSSGATCGDSWWPWAGRRR